MDFINAQLTERISNSSLIITLVFPPPLPIVGGISPGAAPTNLLTGPASTRAVIEPDPTPVAGSRTMPCLWLDIATGGELTDRTTQERRFFEHVGWQAGASALVRVLVSDAAVDPEKPYGGSYFDSCSYVEFQTKRYKVLQVVPFSSGAKLPHTYHVWLGGDR